MNLTVFLTSSQYYIGEKINWSEILHRHHNGLTNIAYLQ